MTTKIDFARQKINALTDEVRKRRHWSEGHGPDAADRKHLREVYALAARLSSMCEGECSLTVVQALYKMLREAVDVADSIEGLDTLTRLAIANVEFMMEQQIDLEFGERHE